MIEPARLRALMTLRGLSQSELARRVGITQATVYKLLSGAIYGTKHLHRIARELGTTPAYLTGETDDPLSDMPDKNPLTFEEGELVECYRQLTPPDRAALIRIARALAGRDAAPATIHAPAQDYHPPPRQLAAA